MSVPPKLVFDTNTLISRLLIPDSVPAQAVTRGLQCGRVLVSDATLGELADVLGRSKFDRYISVQDRQAFFRVFGRVVQRVAIIRRVQRCRDPGDDKFLELAINARASHLITGDRDLLVLNPFHTTQIVTPADFLELMAQT